ncbi:MAG: hypothetical protein ACFUZC_14880 [Chthoniobacteraceae bacterium]
MRTLSSDDLDLLRHLPAYALADISPDVPYAALHPLLDLGLGLATLDPDYFPRIDAVGTASAPFLVSVLHSGGEQKDALLRAILRECVNPAAIEIHHAETAIPDDMPF